MNKLSNRWVQLALCIGVFFLISAPQYLWALFVQTFLAKFNVPLSEIQITFSLVLISMTFITPFAGYLHDRFNSKIIIACGLLMCSSSWVLASTASTVGQLYLSYGLLGGLGSGIAFIGCTGLVQKCFPDKRGLANGILSSAFALGPIVSTYFISKSISVIGVEGSLYKYGFIFMIIGFVIILGLKPFESIERPAGTSSAELKGISPKEMLKTKIFWLMFLMMSLVATCGMMITSNIAVIAKEYGVGGPDIIMFGMAAVPLALMLDRITNGFSRFLFGYISDKIGRENTLGVAFFLEAVFVLLWFLQLHDVVWFIVLSGMVFLAWGEIFSVFPALCTDTFGEKFASINFGFLFASAGIGSILGGPVAAYFREVTGSWNSVFYTIVVLEIITAFLAVFVLKRMCRAYKQTRAF